MMMCDYVWYALEGRDVQVHAFQEQTSRTSQALRPSRSNTLNASRIFLLIWMTCSVSGGLGGSSPIEPLIWRQTNKLTQLAWDWKFAAVKDDDARIAAVYTGVGWHCGPVEAAISSCVIVGTDCVLLLLWWYDSHTNLIRVTSLIQETLHPWSHCCCNIWDINIGFQVLMCSLCCEYLRLRVWVQMGWCGGGCGCECGCRCGCTHVHITTNIHAHTRMFLCAHAHRHTQTHAHTHIHTHTHTHTHARRAHKQIQNCTT